MRKLVQNLKIALGAALVIGVSGTAIGGVDPAVASRLASPPSLSMEQALRLPKLQPLGLVNPAALEGITQIRELDIGPRSYEVTYTYADGAWQLVGFAMLPVASLDAKQKNPAVARVPNGLMHLSGENDGIGSGPEPDTDDFTPFPPHDPEASATTTIRRCNWLGGLWDIEVTYTWIPGHSEGEGEDEHWVDGHWSPTFHRKSLSLPFC